MSLVVSIFDGDAIEVLHNTHAERVRFSGIKCSEKGQAHSTRAKQTASAVVFERDVILQTHGQAEYARTLADVLLPDGTNVNHELVKGGWCWWYRRHAPGDHALKALEQNPREQRGDYGQNLILCRIGYSAGFVQERVHCRCLQGGQS